MESGVIINKQDLLIVFRAIYRHFKQNRFFQESLGQDVAEYCLITALIVLVALGIFWHVSGGIQGMWNDASTQLTAGNSTTGTGITSSGQTSGNTAQ
jgi:Flp pilus assembly pilin Flp